MANTEGRERTNSPFNSKVTNGVVYHYCSVQTMISILSNHTLRTSNIRKSNDYHEVISSIPTFQNAFKGACNDFVKNYPDPTFINLINGFDSDEYIASLIDNDTLTYYCVCFSQEKDLLSQWRGYADDGKGVAIGFNQKFFSEFTDYCQIKYYPIMYDKNSLCKNLKEYFYNQLVKAYKILDGIPSEDEYERVLFGFFSSMVYNAIFCKDESFKAEKEHRLVFYPFGEIRNLKKRNKQHDTDAYELFYDRMYELIGHSVKYGKLTRKPIGFSWRNNSFSSYVDLDFNKYFPYIIPEIVLGPQCNIDDLDFRMFLLSSGIDVHHTRITHSKVSYQ